METVKNVDITMVEVCVTLTGVYFKGLLKIGAKHLPTWIGGLGNIDSSLLPAQVQCYDAV